MAFEESREKMGIVTELWAGKHVPIEGQVREIRGERGDAGIQGGSLHAVGIVAHQVVAEGEAVDRPYAGPSR